MLVILKGSLYVSQHCYPGKDAVSMKKTKDERLKIKEEPVIPLGSLHVP
jgi:hypothetical protein